MTDRHSDDPRVQENQADERVEAEQDAIKPSREAAESDEPIEGSAFGASSSESGGNYDLAGPTAANVEGEPMDAEETTSDEPSSS